MIPVRLPGRVYALLAGLAVAGAAILALTYPPDRLIGLMFESDEDFVQAIHFFRAWTAAHPGDQEARWHTVDLLLAMARPEDAIAELQSMRTRWPKEPEILRRLAEISNGLLDAERALAFDEARAELQPDDREVLHALIGGYRWFGRTEQLLSALERDLELQDVTEEHRELIDLRLAREEYADLEAFYRRYVVRRPDCAEAYLALFEVALRQERPADAAAALGALLRIQPQDPENAERDDALRAQTFEREVKELVAAGDREGAILLFRKRIAEDPTSVPLRIGLGELYGPRADAVAAEELRKLVAIAPDSARGWRALARRLTWTGDVRGAADAYAHAVQLEPADLATRRAFARALGLANQRREAIEQYRMVLGQGGGTVDRKALIDLLIEANRHAEAVEEARVLLSDLPSDVEVLRRLARAALGSHQCGRVMAELSQATRRFSRDPEVWSLYGLCARQLRRNDEALDALRRATQLHRADVDR